MTFSSRELAYEVLMDTNWIIKEIDSDQQDYKVWFNFLEKCTESDKVSINISQVLS